MKKKENKFLSALSNVTEAIVINNLVNMERESYAVRRDAILKKISYAEVQYSCATKFSEMVYWKEELSNLKREYMNL